MTPNNPADSVREALAWLRDESARIKTLGIDSTADRLFDAAELLAALTARVAASEMDAARWRWMWDHDAALLAKFAAGGKTAGYYVTTHDGQGAVERIFPVCDTPESAIDAAMQEPQP